MRRLHILVLIALALLVGASCTFGQTDYTTTANLGLKKPKLGSTNFGVYINQDFDTLDAAIGVFKGGFVTDPFAATYVIDLTKGNTHQITLTGNVTSSSVNQPLIQKGQLLYLIVCQDGTGSRSFAFPASFQTPTPTLTIVAGKCSDTTWQWNGVQWISAGGGGSSGGGGTPSAPTASLQYNNLGVFGGTQFLYAPAENSFCVGSTCASVATSTDSNILLLATGGFNGISLVAQHDVANIGVGTSVEVNSTVTLSAFTAGFRSDVQIGGAVGNASSGCYVFVGAAPSCGMGSFLTVGDAIGDTANGQDIVGQGISIALNKTAGHTVNHVAGFAVYTPQNFSSGGSPPIVETAASLYGLEVQDLGGHTTSDQAAVIIRSQTAPGGGTTFAIEALSGSGLSLLNDGAQGAFWRTNSANPATTSAIRLASADAVTWRNNANNGNISLTKNASDALLWNSGQIALLNLAQNYTATQTINSGSELHFLGSNATNFEGFKVNASLASNLVWALPLTDSTGTQCLSSNGSLGLAWSNCSAGTGTPGGASTNVQYNNTGSFAGSNAFTFNGTDTVGVGQLNTVLGKLQLFGNTSGSVTIQTQAVAGGTLAFTLPNASGTAQVSASAPVVASATTGNLTCPTCTTNAAALTLNQLVIGGGAQAASTLGSLGTTTTVLHGNASGAPSFAAVNLGTDTTGTTAIANGGTGQTTATAAFNALSPITSTGDLILGNGANSATRLAIGTNGLCLVSNGTTATWNSCAAGAIGGSGTSGQVTFFNGATSITGSSNYTYAAGSGISLIQGANATDMLYGKRFTGTGPTGNFLHFQNETATVDMFKLDVLGNLTTAGTITFSSSAAGTLQLTPGAAPAISPGNIQLIAPTTVAGSGEQFTFPSTPANGFIRWTNAAGVLSGAFVAASGVGTCTNQVITATNDNAAPTCSNAAANMFASQLANTFLVAPNGSSGVPTFRVMASGDIPAINLNSTSNGGVTGTLPILQGGTNGTTALAAFNNLSPMTTAGDIIYGGASGSGTRLAASTVHTLLHSGTTPSWSAVDQATEITGVTPLANGGTNASSGLANTNGFVYSDGTKLVSTATGGAGTLCAISVSGGTPTWGSCAGSASTVWSALTNPAGDLSLSMGTNNSLFTHSVMTGTRNAWEIVDGASTSTGALMFLHTAASSTMKPLKVTAVGTANGIQMDTTGSLTAIGSGAITATSTSLTISTTSPLGGGGAFNANLTLTCATCVTSGSALTSTALVVGSGGGQGTASGNLSGDVTTTNSAVTTIAANAVTAAKSAVDLTLRTCTIVVGADNAGSALANADIAPQLQQCQIPYAATVVEIDVRADAGTPNVVVAKRHCTASACTVGANETVSNLTSSALATAAAGAAACSNTGGTAGFDTFTTCSATLQNTSLAIGDYIETHTATAGGTAKRMTILVHYTVN